MGHPLRFNTGHASANACLLRLEALANQPSSQIADGVSLEEWINDVLREMRALPHELLRRLNPETLYFWDSPRKWDRLRIGSFYAKVSSDLRQRLGALMDPKHAGIVLPAAISSSIGVTHSFRHNLREGLTGVFQVEALEVPQEIRAQIERLTAAEGGAQPST